ncbi:hypothetical protein MGI18_25975 [Bacillus sp. OVS6]|nr:hypothetical protein MGI18_25975 [Bacillus sp. OVS6]
MVKIIKPFYKTRILPYELGLSLGKMAVRQTELMEIFERFEEKEFYKNTVLDL